MTPTEIALVKSSFEKLELIAEAAAALFYQRLFEIAPEVRPLFKTDIEDQGHKLMATLGSVVRSLDRWESVMPALKPLAVRHALYGVRPEHYEPVGAALLWTLQQVFGNGFTPELKAAWTTAYDTLSRAMIAETHREAAA